MKFRACGIIRCSMRNTRENRKWKPMVTTVCGLGSKDRVKGLGLRLRARAQGIVEFGMRRSVSS